MASFEVDAYYAEQDVRMNQGDETVDQFRERLSGFNRRYVQLHRGTRYELEILQSQGFNYASTSRIPEAIRSISSISTPHEEVGSRLINADEREDVGNNLKRKASVQPLESAGKRPKIASSFVEEEDNSRRCVPSRSPELSGRPSQNLQPADKCTSDVEEIDSFTVLMSNPPKASTPESGKRKSVPANLRRSPRRSKHLQDHSSKPQPSPEPPTANFSPYVVLCGSKAANILNSVAEYRLFREA